MRGQFGSRRKCLSFGRKDSRGVDGFGCIKEDVEEKLLVKYIA
jgi:hypothetical protein